MAINIEILKFISLNYNYVAVVAGVLLIATDS